MNLFKINHQLHPVNLNPLRLKTPFGNLLFNCTVADKSLLIAKPSTMQLFQSVDIASSWISDEYNVEFIRLNFIPKLPPGLKVDHCIFAAWRVKSLKKMVKCNFSCCFEKDLVGSPEPGEGVLAQSFENNECKLIIGTEDEEYLQHRAESQYWLPNHFKTEIEADQINYLSNGIEVALPELSKNEELQIHFVISWTSKEKSDISAWYAVDQSAKNVLDQAGIK